MKYLRKYNENIKATEDLEDILKDLKDEDDFKLFAIEKDGDIIVGFLKNELREFFINEILESVDRIISYMNSNDFKISEIEVVTRHYDLHKKSQKIKLSIEEFKKLPTNIKILLANFYFN